MRGSPQVVIVGAGMAGLAAARVLVAHGIEIELLEARERVGGRAHTLHDPDGDLPIELGPEFIHGRPDATLSLLHEAHLRTEDIADTHHVRRGGRLVAQRDMWERFGTLVERGGEVAGDESARAYLDRAKLPAEDAELFAMLVEGFYAAPLDDISMASIRADASGEATAQARVRGGYGALVSWLHEQLGHAHATVRLWSKVRSVDWSSDRVRITYKSYGLHEHCTVAPYAILTLPVGVLQATGEAAIHFTPALGQHAAALEQLAMGQVVKLVLCLREPVWHDHAPRDLEFVHARGSAFPAYWLRSSRGCHQVTAWAGGPHAQALAHCPTAVLVERAVDGFTRALGMTQARFLDALAHHHFHDFAVDPCARGAYSYTRVGGGDAAKLLARPLGDRVFFAGEATDADHAGSVAGALASGARAANDVLHRLRRASRAA